MSNPYIGEIRAFGFGFAPRGWHICDGTLLGINSNQVLFSLIGTTYGGNGAQTFGLPDLLGRSIVGAGTSRSGISPIEQGQLGGVESVSIQIGNMPTHNHVATLYAESQPAAANKATNRLLGEGAFYVDPNPSANLAFAPEAITVSMAGGNIPVFVRNPYQGLLYCIALEGLFPSRN